MGKSLTNIAGWEEKDPSRCATHSRFGKKPNICVHTMFHKDSCNMVRVVMVLMKGVQIGTL
jgi:hypothetical protein